MKSYGMTDINLNSNMRPGDTCAPKLPPRQQSMVDSFFNHKASPMAAQMQRAGANAMAGAYRDPSNPVAATLHRRRETPAHQMPMPKAEVNVKSQNNIALTIRCYAANKMHIPQSKLGNWTQSLVDDCSVSLAQPHRARDCDEKPVSDGR